jgi:hypothetical protein
MNLLFHTQDIDSGSIRCSLGHLDNFLEVTLLVTRLRPRNANVKVNEELVRLKYSTKLSLQ